MTSHNAGTPVSSPKIAKSVKLDVPSTPPAAKPKKRLSAFLATPEQPGDQLPFSPGLKRDSSGLLKSPDYKLNSNDANLLKTPKNGGYDSDDKDTPHRSKMLRTPQFFSPGKRLFNDDQSPNKEELAEISSQLKSRLSTALGKVKGHDKSQIAPTKLDFSDQSFTTTRESPTKMLKMSPRLQSTPSSVQRANLNLQTLQASPVPPSSQSHERLQQSPDFKRDRVRIPSPEADASAQSALQAAFSRQKEKRRSFSSERRRSSLLGLEGSPQKDKEAPRLPPINVGFNNKHSPPQDSEQDAVFSLMSLSSPQKLADSRGHSRQQSQNTNSTHTSRSSSVVNTVLPPISGIMKNVDNDETDIEETTMSEGEDSS
ncbi:uncharacterized protein CXQ87_004663 [Candidozyma duobushaemuli]|uniref:Uncharacterized protein n=2 Tax=Candidozyma TaxID=3303203 RepID=A0ABX8ICU4_9ASCO|nr:uncharacterized protein CXQ87_004663 [[Candida] duobushaemulonis]PVH17102.1 hypothetical protein CXQ87_004663 [[Candida] duobushaemulonis]QWU89862.1 hypothetical protein CA3LBN_004210 [[Candida] haemuloni]